MSVINKMLRDLDKRDSEPAAERKHTVSVAATAQAARPRRQPTGLRIPMLLVALLVLAGAGWWGWQQMRVVDTPMPQPQLQPAVSAVSATPASAPTSEPAPVLAAVSPDTSTPPVAQAAAPVRQPVVEAPRVAMTAPAVLTAPANPPLKIETTLKLPKGIKETPAASATAQAAAPPTLAAGPRLLQAGREAQVQAQALWNSGAKEAAMDLLQQAVGNLERGLASEPVAGQTQLLSTLARDLTRMQLTDGRPGAAWDLLIRLEPWVRDDADLWAQRGNAAQRLGRHQDSAHAYMAALQFRPTEQRWLLGAAVSLAASGQTAAAAEMVEKARAVGSISPEVQAYLRQAGVPIKDK